MTEVMEAAILQALTKAITTLPDDHVSPAKGLTLIVDCSQSPEMDLTLLAQTFRTKYSRALRFMMSLGYVSIWLIGVTPASSVLLWPPP